MARPWNNAISGATAAFPTAIMSPWNVRTRDTNGYAVSNESVPTAMFREFGSGRWRAFLDLVPLEQSTVTILDADTEEALTYVAWGETPAAGEYALSLETGAIEVHAEQKANGILASYTGIGTNVGPGLLNELTAELVAVQTLLGGVDRPIASEVVNLKAPAGTNIQIGSVLTRAFEITRVRVLLASSSDVVTLPWIKAGTNRMGKSDVVMSDGELTGLGLNGVHSEPGIGGARYVAGATIPNEQCQITVILPADATTYTAEVTFFGIPVG